MAISPEEIKLPEMIDMGSYRIMKHEVTVGLFKQVMPGYKLPILTKPEEPLLYVSLNDAREFALRLSALTGRKFRVQTEAEWLQAKDQLAGENWTWTETKYNDETYVLRQLGNNNRSSRFPQYGWDPDGIRLVEDK